MSTGLGDVIFLNFTTGSSHKRFRIVSTRTKLIIASVLEVFTIGASVENFGLNKKDQTSSVK